MSMAMMASNAGMRLVRHRVLLHSLWWLIVGTTMLCSCEPGVAKIADVGPWRAGSAVGSTGVPSPSAAPWANVAKIPGGGGPGTRGAA